MSPEVQQEFNDLEEKLVGYSSKYGISIDTIPEFPELFSFEELQDIHSIYLKQVELLMNPYNSNNIITLFSRK